MCHAGVAVETLLEPFFASQDLRGGIGELETKQGVAGGEMKQVPEALKEGRRDDVEERDLISIEGTD